MKFDIEYTGTAGEAMAIEAFLVWQNARCELHSVPTRFIFEHTKGRKVPVVKQGETVVALGFMNLIQYWKDQGLFLC